MNDKQHKPITGLFGTSDSNKEALQQLAASLQLPVIQQDPESLGAGDFALVLDEANILSLNACGPKAAGPVVVDFASGAAAHRRQFGGGKGQLVAKAVGIKSGFRPNVLDLTAGLGQDAFVLATLGCQMTLVERESVVFHLLANGLERAKMVDDIHLSEIVSRIALYHNNGIDYLKNLEKPVDVIYLDPMFPERDKSAKVKKSMAAFHQIVGEDNDAGELLALALTKAKYRVVVKRPRKAPSVAQQYPHLSIAPAGLVLEGKSTRYDIYPFAKMPA